MATRRRPSTNSVALELKMDFVDWAGVNMDSVRNEQGAALITMLVVISLLLLTGVALINGTFFDARMAVRNERQIVAHFHARTGLEMAQAVILSDDGSDVRTEVRQLFADSSTENQTLYLHSVFPDPEDLNGAEFSLTQDDPRDENGSVTPGSIVVVMELIHDTGNYVLIEASSTANVQGQEETALLSVELTIQEG